MLVYIDIYKQNYFITHLCRVCCFLAKCVKVYFPSNCIIAKVHVIPRHATSFVYLLGLFVCKINKRWIVNKTVSNTVRAHNIFSCKQLTNKKKHETENVCGYWYLRLSCTSLAKVFSINLFLLSFYINEITQIWNHRYLIR